MDGLNNGTLRLNAVELRPDTPVKQMKHLFPDAIITENASADSVFIRCIKPLRADDLTVLGEFNFVGGYPNVVILRPVVLYPEWVVQPGDRQAFRREICDSWLAKRLGIPNSVSQQETRYAYSWGTISSVSHIGPNYASDGGYLCLRYVR